MIIFTLTYTKPLEEVDKWLDAHCKFLKKHYQLGHFVASGPQIPRIGGVIICNTDRAKAEKIMQEDPFFSQAIAEYSITEFNATAIDKNNI